MPESRRRHGMWGHRRSPRESQADRPVHDELIDEFDDLHPNLGRPSLGEEDYEEARRIVEEKVRFYSEAGKKGIITLLLLIFIPPIGIILGIVWGIKLGQRFFRYFVEPRLRERVLGEEVGERIREGIGHDRRMLENEHSRSLEKLSASIAHEIRNPITAAKSLVQQMEENPSAIENSEYARVALSELERVERSISHLLRFARDEDLRLAEIRMRDVVDSALDTFRDRAGRSGVEIASEFDSDGTLMGDAEKLRRVMINLIGNAFDAVEELDRGGRRIEVAMGENLAGSEVWVRVRDNGVGMNAAARDRAFSPFVTSKATGTGLGLPICKKIMDAHAGDIEIQTPAGRGTEFILTLPKQRHNGGTRS